MGKTEIREAIEESKGNKKPRTKNYLLILVAVLAIVVFYVLINNSIKFNGPHPRETQERCEAGGGNWTVFPSSCHDECWQPKNPTCMTVFSAGCDCGPYRCWDGYACEYL